MQTPLRRRRRKKIDENIDLSVSSPLISTVNMFGSRAYTSISGNKRKDELATGIEQPCGRTIRTKYFLEKYQMKSYFLFVFSIDTPKLASKAKGSAVYTFGNAALAKNIDSTNFDGQKVKIQQISPNSNKTEFLTWNDKFMLDSFVEKCWIKYDDLYSIGYEIYKNYLKLNPDVKQDEADDDDDDLKNVNLSSQKLKRCIGRVYGDEKLVADSTHFVGLDQKDYRTVQLNFNKCQTCALFPGQTVLIEGYNPRGDTFYVENIFAERPLERAPTPSIQNPLNIVIASGPYTNGQDLTYDPLRDLMHYVKEHKPNVLILIGPFIDANHQRIIDGALKESFDLYFEKMIGGIMDVVG